MKPAFTDPNQPDATRRTVLAGGAVAAVSATLSMAALGAEPPAADPADATRTQEVQFPNNDIRMAGILFFPEGFTATGKYPAVIVVHPGGGVKEQTASLYASALARQGFLTLAFDASHQGASGGMPRFLDDPMRRVGDIYSAVDYMTTLPYVDNARIGALGICAGSGATVKAASTDRRIRAIGTVSAVDVGAAFRQGWDGKGKVADQIKTLDAAGRQRTAEAGGAAPVYIPYVPAVGDRSAPYDLQQAADYYLTPRGQHPNAPNKMLLASASYMIAFTGFDRLETLTQPVMIVAGSKAGSLWHSKALFARAPGRKELAVIPGATHMDLYDGPGMGLAMAKLGPYFKRNLA
ncbi:alpha/beta hydrolase [Pseudoduganella umbonata]|uniref:Alpha/beta hydrolase n=1 Tax=Pseudoduganella umbonata TaxID=864828 RepID=A0A4P8HMM5_9BURK|nr:alpha/beta hydrolase [Pseudoduganella umbonata]MBB3219545.1 hypothetical protein [Pseudoduganella umbonata]QCP09618.1 alpha/beta hydrolase [Pseudoduganella umbonata]